MLARYIHVACIVLFAVLTVTYLSIADRGRADQLESVSDPDQLEQIRRDHTPGLSIAEELGLTRNFNKRYPIPDTGYTLQIDKVWYNSEWIYFFYNVDFGDDPVTNETVPTLNFRVTTAGEETIWDEGTFTKNWAPEQGLVLENRYYHRVMTHPLKNERLEPLAAVDTIRLMHVEVSIGEHVYELPDIELEVGYAAHNEREKSIALNDEVFFGEHRIQFEKLTLGTAKNVLQFRFEPGTDAVQLAELAAELISDEGEVRELTPVYVRQLDDDTYAAQFAPFGNWPESVQLRLQALRLIGEETFSHRLDVSDWELPLEDEQEWEWKENLGTFHETTVFLDSITLNERGAYVQIRYDHSSKQERLYSASLQDRRWFEDGSWDGGLLLEVIDNDGVRADIEELSHDRDSYGFLLPANFVASAEWIELKVERLLYELIDNQQLEWAVNSKET